MTKVSRYLAGHLKAKDDLLAPQMVHCAEHGGRGRFAGSNYTFNIHKIKQLHSLIPEIKRF
jgi:hypothetical protein